MPSREKVSSQFLVNIGKNLVKISAITGENLHMCDPTTEMQVYHEKVFYMMRLYYSVMGFL